MYSLRDDLSRAERVPHSLSRFQSRRAINLYRFYVRQTLCTTLHNIVHQEITICAMNCLNKLIGGVSRQPLPTPLLLDRHSTRVEPAMSDFPMSGRLLLVC